MFRLSFGAIWDRRSTDMTQNPVGSEPRAFELDAAVADIDAAVEKLRASSSD